jgi:hypothetical protein
MAAMTNVANFSKANRGKVMGVLSAVFALSGAVFTLVAGRFGLRSTPGTGNATAAYSCNPERGNTDGPLSGADGNTDSAGGGEQGVLQERTTSEPIYFFAFMALITGCVGLTGAFFMRRDDVGHDVGVHWQARGTSSADAATSSSGGGAGADGLRVASSAARASRRDRMHSDVQVNNADYSEDDDDSDAVLTLPLMHDDPFRVADDESVGAPTLLEQEHTAHVNRHRFDEKREDQPITFELDLTAVDERVLSTSPSKHPFRRLGSGVQGPQHPHHRASPSVDVHGVDLLRDRRFQLLFACMLVEDGTYLERGAPPPILASQ